MEPVEAEMKLPRQPLPVTVTIRGIEAIDVETWYNKLKRQAESVDMVNDVQYERGSLERTFKIYPRAVNE